MKVLSSETNCILARRSKVLQRWKSIQFSLGGLNIRGGSAVSGGTIDKFQLQAAVLEAQ